MSAIKNVVQAVMKTAVEVAPDTWFPGGKPDSLIQHKHGLIGAPVSRLDGQLKVTGAAPFAAEFPVDEILAALTYAAIPKGRIKTLDTTAAEAAPGVVLVMTHQNAPKLEPTPVFNSEPKAAGPSDLPILQDDRIHWNGEAIAVVLAETQEEADYAKSLIRATYEVEDAVVAFDSAKTHARCPQMFWVSPRHWKKEMPKRRSPLRSIKLTSPTRPRSTTTTPSNCMRQRSFGIPAASSSSTMPAKP